MITSRLLRASPRIARNLRTARQYTTKPADAASPQPHPPAQPPNPNQAPPPPKKAPSRVGTFYRNNTYPVLKSFLLALFTYQLAYYVWLKLEVVEEKSEQQGTIKSLENEVKKAVAQQKRNASDAVEKVIGGSNTGSEANEKKKKGWLW